MGKYLGRSWNNYLGFKYVPFRSYTREGQEMRLIEHFDKEQTVEDTLIAFMEAIEEWESEIEGTASSDEMKELNKIYEITESNLRFIINNDNPPAENPPQ